ncbi:MAG: ATP-binding cassette domain-containing protein [Nitrospiraceae bacterium]
MSDKYAIFVRQLTKIYPPDLRAVNGLDLSVKEGEIMALLGPNGAGKSTAIRVLSTLSGFDSGQALVGGIDVDIHPEKVRQTIGVVAQKTGVDYFLTGRENMTLQGQLYRMKKADIKARIDELAEYFELSDSLDKTVTAYSGGMTRKLDIATALIHRPKILYLDEPTLGLDIRSRKILWKHIEELNRNFGLTILLTTHYLEEADKLSHRVSIINAGKIRIVGTPEELKTGIHGDSVVVSFDTVGEGERGFAAGLKEARLARDAVWDGNNLHLYVENGAGCVPQIMEQAAHRELHIKTLSLARPTLDDVFLKYTGTSMVETGEEEPEQWWTQWAGKGGGGNWKKTAKKWGYDADAENPDWQGNEWVDKDGKPKGDLKENASDDSAATAPAEAKSWQGNEWVGEDGAQKGDWGSSPDWQGNEWVDNDGKPRANWENQPKQAAGTPSSPAAGLADKKTSDGEWQGNQWVDKKGEQTGNWGDSSGWKGNEWVDEHGKTKGDWSQDPAKKERD